MTHPSRPTIDFGAIAASINGDPALILATLMLLKKRGIIELFAHMPVEGGMRAVPIEEAFAQEQDSILTVEAPFSPVPPNLIGYWVDPIKVLPSPAFEKRVSTPVLTWVEYPDGTQDFQVDIYDLDQHTWLGAAAAGGTVVAWARVVGPY